MKVLSGPPAVGAPRLWRRLSVVGDQLPGKSERPTRTGSEIVSTSNEKPHSRPLRVLEWGTLKIFFFEVKVLPGPPAERPTRAESEIVSTSNEKPHSRPLRVLEMGHPQDFLF